MLNWIDKNERLPTKEDVSELGYLYAVTKSGIVNAFYLEHFETVVTSFTHWLPFREMPIPKRWRVPTIHDLAKAGKPIPCRVRDNESEGWKDCKADLHAISLDELRTHHFYVGCTSYRFCEIED